MKQNFFHRYLSAKVLPIWTILLIDIFIIVASCLLAYSLRYDFRSIFLDSSTIDKTILWTVVANLIFFRVFRTYSNVLRFSSFVDIMRIFVLLTVSYGVLMILSLLLDAYLGIRIGAISVLFMAYVINFAMMACSRIVVKMFFEVLNFDGSHTTNVFIYGAKEAGVNIAKSLRVNLRNHYRLRGFIADEPELIGKVMMGAKVFPNDEALIENMNDRDVHTIIVSPAKMEKLKKSDMIDTLLSNNVKLLTAPPLSEWGGQALNKTQLKEIQIEDLLQREPIEVDIHKIASHLEGKRVMITGAAGSIGSEIMRQVASFNPYKLILIDQAETPLHDIRLELQDRWRDIDAETIVADISNATRMEAIFREYKPQYIFHAAAYKHVPMMEDNVLESIQINVSGTRTLADLAVKFGSEKFVMISTDKAVNPTNVMGATKRACEMIIQYKAQHSTDTEFVTTRFGNVLGSNGSVIPLFRREIENGAPVTVTHPDIIRYFMTIPEAVSLVLEAGAMAKGGEIFVLDMGAPVKITTLAENLIRMYGKVPYKDVPIIFTGLRPGEKLFEELLMDEEGLKSTQNKKIFIGNQIKIDETDMLSKLEVLKKTAENNDSEKTVELLAELVPTFCHKVND